MANQRMYNAPGLDISAMALALAKWFQQQEYETQILPGSGEGATVQARKPRSWMLRVGGGPALTMSIAPQKDDNVLVQWGNAKWGMQAVSGVAALIIFWPLLALPAYAAIKQKQLIDETLDFMDRYVGEAGGTQVAALPIAPPTPRPAAKPQPETQARCPACNEPVREGAKFCDHCGAPTEVACAKCGANLRPGAKFCDECGARVEVEG